MSANKCSNCGANAGAAAKFCRACGFPLSGSASAAPKSNLEVAAGAFKLISGGAEPPKVDDALAPAPAPKKPAAVAAQGASASPNGIVASYCVPKDAAQAEENGKYNAVVRMFVGKNANVQAFLAWVSAQKEQELANKLAFARSKVGAQNPAFTALVPVVCPELTDLPALTRNSAAKFETLYWSIMGEALEVLLMGSAKLESVPLPDIDPTESAEKQQYARTMHELKATLQATKPDDDATWDSMLQKHRATGGDAVVMIFEHWLKAHNVSADFLYIFRRLRCQLLFRFFVLLLSFYLNEKDAKKP